MVKRSLFFVLILLPSLAALTQSQVPNSFSYQGLLTTAAGTPVPDGSYKLQFDLFTAPTGGLPFWTEVDSGITVQRGTFGARLGAVTLLPDSFHGHCSSRSQCSPVRGSAHRRPSHRARH